MFELVFCLWAKTLDANPTAHKPAHEVAHYAWFGMGVPKGTPAAVVDTLYKAADEALADPQIKARLAEIGAEPINLDPAAFAAHIAAETDKGVKVIKLSGAKVE